MTAVAKVSRAQFEALDAMSRGRFDITVFAREVLGLAPNPAQERWFQFINPAEDGWSWRFKFVIHVAANQIGKTLGTAVLILWACTYKIGVEPPADGDDAAYRDWVARPYMWFHVAPTQQQAYLPLDDIVLLIQGAHPAQDKSGLKCRWLPGLVQEVKVEQYYRGLSFANGSICQFRTTEDKAKALQGRRAAGITFDEAAFEDHLKAVVNETLLMRLVAMGGPLFLIGTPNGINDYYEFVQAALEGGAHPDGRPHLGDACVRCPRAWVNGEYALAWSHVSDNVGFGLSQGEVERMEENLDEATKEQQLRGAFLEPAEAFFVPSGAVLSAFRQLPELEGPKPGHVYVIFWDPSIASDPTACVVFDITPIRDKNGNLRPWRGVALKHHKKPLGITQLIQEMWALHALYNSAEDPRRVLPRSRAITGFDGTSMGGNIVRQLLAGMTPIRPMDFAGSSAKKLTALTNLRAALVEGKLILPDQWTVAKREVLNYRLKDDKLQQDVVMALAGAADIASKGFSGVTARPFNVSARVTPRPAWR